VRSRTVDPSGSKGVVREAAADREEASASRTTGPLTANDGRESGVEADRREDRSAGTDSPSQAHGDAPAEFEVEHAGVATSRRRIGASSDGPRQQQAATRFESQQEPAFRGAGDFAEHARASEPVQGIPTAAAQAVRRSQERSRRSRASMGFPEYGPCEPL